MRLFGKPALTDLVRLKSRLRAALAREQSVNAPIPELERWLSGDEQYCVLIKHHRKRSVYALRSENTSVSTVFVKHFHPPAFSEVVKNAVRPEVVREYRIGKVLAALGLPVPEPLACAWQGGQGLLATRAIADARSSTDLWHAVRNTPKRRQQYLRGLSQFLSLLVRKKVWHRDLHLGNVLVVEDGNGMHFYLVDLYEVQVVRRLTPARQRTMLELLAAFHQEISSDEAREVLRPLYEGKQDSELEELWQSLCHRAVEKAHQRWRKRRKALLRDSSICQKKHTPLGTWRLRRGFDLNLAESILHLYRTCPKTSAGCHSEPQSGEESRLETLDNRALRTAVVSVQGTAYVVKQFSQSNVWSRFSRDCQNWLNNWRLELCGISVAKYLGWLRAKNGYGYLIREYIPGVSYDKALGLHRDETAQAHLRYRLSVLVQRLALYGIMHENLNACTLIVVDPLSPPSPFPQWYPDTVAGQAEIVLIDSDAVRFQSS